jgi:lipopolysaccharide biosynthesis protein
LKKANNLDSSNCDPNFDICISLILRAILKNSKSICLFAHFNASMKVSDYVITYLEHLQWLGYEIYFISNSCIKEEYQHLLSSKIKHCRIFERENKGADFAAWKWAIEENIIPEDADSILLTNDSLYGPFFSLTPIIEKMKSEPGIDFWGLTDSYQGGWHIQSYFLWLSKKVFDSLSFKAVFSSNFSKLSKLEIIRQGELQLTKALSDAGFKGMAYIPYKDVSPDEEDWDRKNPTHFYWDRLIEKFQLPFVKKDLVLQNPEIIQNIDKLFALIEKHSSYPVEIIKRSISDYLTLYDSTTTFTEKISVICHLYYPGTIYYFLTRLFPLKSSQTQFIFNLSSSLYNNSFFREVLTKYFTGSIIIYTPNQGRDIGGKLAAIDVGMRSGIQTEYTLIIHDKLSPHTPTGIKWRDDLLKVIDPDELQAVFLKFRQDEKVGVITNKELIKNEYDPDRNAFTCTSSKNLLNYISKYELHMSDYNFAAGTIFWIKTEILRKFFSEHSPLSVRKDFEKGNSLDFDKGTNIHAWERLFSFVAHSQGFKTTGV